MALELLLQYKRGIMTSRPVNLLSDTLKAQLCRLSDLGTAITGATNASPIVITAAGHGLATGNRVVVKGVLGNTAANGFFTVTVVDANTFSLDGSAGGGAYTSGGYVYRLDDKTFLGDIAAGGRKAQTAALANAAIAAGGSTLDADDVAITDPGGGQTCDVTFLFKDTGVAATSNLIAVDDSFSLTLDGTNDTLQWNAQGIFAL